MRLRKIFLLTLITGAFLLSACGKEDGIQTAEKPMLTATPAATAPEADAPSIPSPEKASDSINPTSPASARASAEESANVSPLKESEEEVSTLSFLTEEQQAIYNRAADASLILFDGAENIRAHGFSPQSSDGKTIDIVNGYELWENSYKELSDWFEGIFTKNFLAQTDYDNKFVDYHGQLATNFLSSPLVEGCWRGTLDKYPDTYRAGIQTADTINFVLISHYDKNWNTDKPMEIYTVEYPIRMLLTDAGWRLDEFHTTEYA